MRGKLASGKLLMLMAISLLIVFIAGCSGGQKTKEAEEWRIGALYPFTGNLALLGTESFRGLELATMVKNEQGGILGKKIVLVKGDATDTNASKAEAERLINNEKVKSILGTYSSSLAYTASEVAERNGVTYFELGAIADNITQRNFKYTFRTCPNASSFGVLASKFMIEAVAPKLGVDPKSLKVALAHEDSLYGTAVMAAAEEYLKNNGITPLAKIPYSSSTTDLSSVILKLKQLQPDILIVTSYANDAILFWRQAKELDLNVKAMIGTGGGHALQDFVKGVGGENAEGILNVDFPQFAVNKSITPGLDEYIQLYEKTYGHKPNSGHSTANYVGAMAFFDVLEKAGSLDPEAIRKAAMAYEQEVNKSINSWGVKFDQTGQNIKALPQMFQWDKEKLVTVWPKEAAVRDYTVMKTWAERKAN